MKSNVPENSSEATRFSIRGYLLRDRWIPLVFVWASLLGGFSPCYLASCDFHIFLGISSCCGFQEWFGDSPASPFRNLCFFSWGKNDPSEPLGEGKKDGKVAQLIGPFGKNEELDFPPKNGDDGG